MVASGREVNSWLMDDDSDVMASCGHHINNLTLLHSEMPKLYTILAYLSAIGIN